MAVKLVMDILYPLTIEVMKALEGVKSFFVEPHDKEDPESSDLIWIVRYADGGMSDGEYLSVSPLHSEGIGWFVSHNAADLYGGHPTYWSKSGSLEELIEILPDYIVNRANELK